MQLDLQRMLLMNAAELAMRFSAGRSFDRKSDDPSQPSPFTTYLRKLIVHERRFVPVIRRGCVMMFDRSSWCVGLRERMTRRGTAKSRPFKQFTKGTRR